MYTYMNFNKIVSMKDYVKQEKEKLKEELSNWNYKPALHIYQIGNNPASNSYIKGKLKDCEEVGIPARLFKLEESISEEELIDFIKDTAKDSHPVILQLPLPEGFDEKYILESALKNPVVQDIDGFISNVFKPCTPHGIMSWLEYNKIDLDGANVVICGRSDIVGKPLAQMMLEANATVTLCHSHTPKYNLQEFVDTADIVVSAIGNKKVFDEIYFYNSSNKRIFIDVGINKDENGKLCGDINKNLPYVSDYWYITPVPGGVGLLTRLTLLWHYFDAVRLYKVGLNSFQNIVKSA